MRLAVVAVLGVTACADAPTLRVDVEHEVQVERTTISVYESELLTCPRIEFGDLDEDELAATRVAFLEIDAAGNTTGSLDDLSRTELKMIVARGYVGDTFMTAGCTEHGEIVGQDEVKVKTFRASSASIGGLSLDMTDPFSVQVSLRDATGAALAGSPVSWRVYAPFGAVPAQSVVPPALDDTSGVWQLAQPTCTRDNGARRLHPVPPAAVGGFAIQVRPSWPIEKPPLITGFTLIGSGVSPMFSVPSLEHPCAVRRNGIAPTLMCIEHDVVNGTTLVLREYRVSEVGGIAEIAEIGEYPMADQDVVAVYGLDRSGGRDVYAITQRGKILRLAGPPTGVTTVGAPTLFTETATDALLMPACGDREARLIVRTDAPMQRRLVVIPALGGPEKPFHDVMHPALGAISLHSVGCVAELGPQGVATPRQAVVIDQPVRSGPGRLLRSVYFDCAQGESSPQCYVDLPLILAGAGFTPDGFLAAVNLDASGVVISKFAVIPDPPSYRRIEFGRVAAASIPKHVVYGDFDGDGKTDGLWDIENIDRTASTLQVSYAQLAGTQPLSALSPNLNFVLDDLLIDDVTGDSKDDIIMIGRSFDDTGSPTGSGVLVIPTQVQAKVPSLSNTDEPCPKR